MQNGGGNIPLEEKSTNWFNSVGHNEQIIQRNCDYDKIRKQKKKDCLQKAKSKNETQYCEDVWFKREYCKK
jgi:hypothetical protein